VAKLLNCSPDDVAILASAGKLRALGRPKPNAVKFFGSIDLMVSLHPPAKAEECAAQLKPVKNRRT